MHGDLLGLERVESFSDALGQHYKFTELRTQTGLAVEREQVGVPVHLQVFDPIESAVEDEEDVGQQAHLVGAG